MPEQGQEWSYEKPGYGIDYPDLLGFVPSGKVYSPVSLTDPYTFKDLLNPYDILDSLFHAASSYPTGGPLGSVLSGATRFTNAPFGGSLFGNLLDSITAGAGSYLNKRASDWAEALSSVNPDLDLSNFRVRSEYPGPSTGWNRSRLQSYDPVSKAYSDVPLESWGSGLRGVLNQVKNFFTGGAPTDLGIAEIRGKAAQNPSSFRVGRSYSGTTESIPSLDSKQRTEIEALANEIVGGIRGGPALPETPTVQDIPAGFYSASMNPTEEAVLGALTSGKSVDISGLGGGREGTWGGSQNSLEAALRAMLEMEQGAGYGGMDLADAARAAVEAGIIS